MGRQTGRSAHQSRSHTAPGRVRARKQGRESEGLDGSGNPSLCRSDSGADHGRPNAMRASILVAWIILLKPGCGRRSPTDDRRVGRLPCRNRLSRGGGSLKSANLPDGRRAKAAIRLENREARGQPPALPQAAVPTAPLDNSPPSAGAPSPPPLERPVFSTRASGISIRTVWSSHKMRDQIICLKSGYDIRQL